MKRSTVITAASCLTTVATAAMAVVQRFDYLAVVRSLELAVRRERLTTIKSQLGRAVTILSGQSKAADVARLRGGVEACITQAEATLKIAEQNSGWTAHVCLLEAIDQVISQARRLLGAVLPS